MNVLIERFLELLQSTVTTTHNEALLQECSIVIKNMCKEVWPCLAVVGSVNPGFRLGGECTVKGDTAGVCGVISDTPRGKQVKVQEVFKEGTDKLEQK